MTPDELNRKLDAYNLHEVQGILVSPKDAPVLRRSPQYDRDHGNWRYKGRNIYIAMDGSLASGAVEIRGKPEKWEPPTFWTCLRAGGLDL